MRNQRTYKTSKSKKSQSRKKDEEQVRTTAYQYQFGCVLQVHGTEYGTEHGTE